MNLRSAFLLARAVLPSMRRRRFGRLRRLGKVQEVADLAVAVIANGFVTGQTIQVNGGAYFT